MKVTPASTNFGKSISFFRPRVAMQLQAVKNKAQTHHVMNLEMATARNYKPDWDDKHQLQITFSELPAVCAVLLGLKDFIECKFHGEDKNHSYSITNQAGIVTFGCSRPADRLAFTLDSSNEDLGAETFWATEFALNQLHLNCSNMTKSDLMNLLKQTMKRRSLP